MTNAACPRCGFKNPEGFKFCGKCGKSIPSEVDHVRAVALSHELERALGRHVAGWSSSSAPDRAAVRADFEKHAGMSPAEATVRMQKLEGHLRGKEFSRIAGLKAPVKELGAYFLHSRERLKLVEKDPKKRKEAEMELAHCTSTAIDLASLLTNFLG